MRVAAAGRCVTAARGLVPCRAAMCRAAVQVLHHSRLSVHRLTAFNPRATPAGDGHGKGRRSKSARASMDQSAGRGGSKGLRHFSMKVGPWMDGGSGLLDPGRWQHFVGPGRWQDWSMALFRAGEYIWTTVLPFFCLAPACLLPSLPGVRKGRVQRSHDVQRGR